MAAIDYTAKATTAAKLIEKFGGPVTLREPGEDEYVPGVGMVPGEPVDWPAAGVKFNYEQDAIDGTLIQQLDQELYLSAVDIPRPNTTHKIIIGSAQFSIITVGSIEPYDVPILYILQIRQ
jgi:hypothetical protein